MSTLKNIFAKEKEVKESGNSSFQFQAKREKKPSQPAASSQANNTSTPPSTATAASAVAPPKEQPKGPFPPNIEFPSLAHACLAELTV